jgi:hypothetical protein
MCFIINSTSKTKITNLDQEENKIIEINQFLLSDHKNDLTRDYLVLNHDVNYEQNKDHFNLSWIYLHISTMNKFNTS